MARLQRQDTPVKPIVKRAKRGSADPLSWQINKTKMLRMKGQKYVSYKKEKNSERSRVERKPRQVGNRCNSKKCENSRSKRQCNLINEEERQHLFQRFWSDMDWKQRKTYVAAMVTKTQTKQKTTKKNQEGKQRSIIT